MEKMLDRLVGEKVSLSLALQPDLATVRADPGQIDQVVMNLAVNARDAMPEGGGLQFATTEVEIGRSEADVKKPAGRYVVLSVTDTGTGMDEETRRRIFEPFYTTKEDGKGTGLGLATVHGIVNQSHGYLEVESEVGKGTTFLVYLPALAGAVQEEGKSRPVGGQIQGTERVLVVDDEPEFREMVRQLLEGLGYAVLMASGGLEALEIAEQEERPIHLVLTDVVMPGMNGRELADKISVTLPDSKTLYMSGYMDDAIVHSGLSGGELAFLQKPFTREDLAYKIREILDGRESAQETAE
jgi:hypothetical protein